MARTRVFKSGNSQAVRIPAELAFANTDIELEIHRSGDVITIVPVHSGMTDVVAALRRLPKPQKVERREAIEIPLRDVE